MFKKPSSATPAKKHLTKVAAKRVRIAKAQRAVFLAEVKERKPDEATRREANVLVERVRAAKTARFLDQYRVTT
ncbi:MAG: hypothetical protein ACTHL8_10675 [Burkholderiaceae bacterium]